jgi:hypothetical protein
MGALSFFVAYVVAWLKSWLFVYLLVCVMMLGSVAGVWAAGGALADSDPLRQLLVVDLLSVLDLVRVMGFVFIALPLVGAVGGFCWKALLGTRSLWRQFAALGLLCVILNLLCAFGAGSLVMSGQSSWLAAIGAWILVFVGLSFFGFMSLLLFFVANAGDWVQSAAQRFSTRSE